MNRMFLKSTEQLSLTVIKAVKGGMKKESLFILSHRLLRERLSTVLAAKDEQSLLTQAKDAGLTKDEVAAVLNTEGISLGQIYYAVNKDKKQAAEALKAAKKQKRNKIKAANTLKDKKNKIASILVTY